MPTRKNWDAHNRKLKATPREFVHAHAAAQTDTILANELTRCGFSTNRSMVAKIRTDAGMMKIGAGCESRPVIPPSTYARYDSPPELSGDALCIGDLEAPFHNADFVNRAVELAQTWKIPQVVFVGDAVHLDSLSSFAPNWEADENGGFSQEAVDELLEIARELPDRVAAKVREKINEKGVREDRQHSGLSKEWRKSRPVFEAFRQVFPSGATLVLGNHEGRLLRALESPIAPSDLVRIISDVKWLKVAPFYFAILKSGKRTWRLTHPKNISVKPADIAALLADKHGCDVVQAHNHLWGSVQSRSGRYQGVEIGCCVDGSRLAYVSQRDSTRPAWQLGACIIRDGYAHLLHPEWTDWKRIRSL